MLVRRRTGRLSILHVATINKPISSDLGYGPIETVICNLDSGLHELGHRSIVACSSGSTVTGEHVQTVSRDLGGYSCGHTPEGQAHIDLHLERALARAQLGDIDIVHMHEWFDRVCTGSFNPSVPIVMTLHVPGHHSGFAEFRERHPASWSRCLLHFVAISEYQRRQYSELVPVTGTVLHGIDVNEQLFKRETNTGSYLLSIGRITEAKGQDSAIAVAKQSGAQLVIAGCVQNKPEDRAYFDRLKKSFDLVVDVGRHPVSEDYHDAVIRPVLSSEKQIIFVGELNTAAKKHWYRHARATLFPIRWGEPFGMVLLESMAAGTPVLAFGEGAVPEIVKHGETGFVVDSVEAMVQAVRRIEEIPRWRCQRHVKRHFSIQRMAEGYESLYQQLVAMPASVPVPVGNRLRPQQSPYIGAIQPGEGSHAERHSSRQW